MDEFRNFKAVLAIDFDHTIANVDFPHIIGLRELAKESINTLYDDNYYIIINTCRDSEHLEEAIKFLNKEGIKYHQINDNNPFLIHFFRSNCRKISADIYIDDKNIDALISPKNLEWHVLYENIIKITKNQNFKSILTSF